MKRLLKILGAVAGLVVVVAAAGLIYLFVAYPKAAPPPDWTVKATPEVLARGEYLVRHVNLCLDCHSERDWDVYGAPVIVGTEGKGGEIFRDVFGEVHAKNITPTALRDWTDGEIARAITSGIDRNGDFLAPMMPYELYRHLAEDDIRAIVAYLRTLAPSDHQVPERELKPPFNIIFRTAPRPYEPVQRPPSSDTLAYGRYMANAAGCYFCHTPLVQGKLVEEMAFAGGHAFPMPDGTIVQSLNITPDAETGIGTWTEAQFLARFQAYRGVTAEQLRPGDGARNTIMPWFSLAGMTDADLRAIYKYLRTVRPVSHDIEIYPDGMNRN